jgi:hypothetical protein
MSPNEESQGKKYNENIKVTDPRLRFPISRAIVGICAARRVSAVRRGRAGNIVVASILTLPSAAPDQGGLLRCPLLF